MQNRGRSKGFPSSDLAALGHLPPGEGLGETDPLAARRMTFSIFNFVYTSTPSRLLARIPTRKDTTATPMLMPAISRNLRPKG